jgi:maltose O-acetyltransferase
MIVRKNLLERVKNRLYLELIRIIQWPRIKFYRLLSTATVIDNGAKILQPVFFSGKGTITLGRCTLGTFPSPLFFSGYMHIEAREFESTISIEDGVFINNNVCVIAERSSIHIEKDTLIGPEVNIFDSDFHGLEPHLRNAGLHKAKPVHIGTNVFIGSRATILKGIEIGRNSVVSAGTVVVKDIPENTIVSGGQPYAERALTGR